jgi:hypothetical protein
LKKKTKYKKIIYNQIKKIWSIIFKYNLILKKLNKKIILLENKIKKTKNNSKHYSYVHGYNNLVFC